MATTGQVELRDRQFVQPSQLLREHQPTFLRVVTQPGQVPRPRGIFRALGPSVLRQQASIGKRANPNKSNPNEEAAGYVSV